MFDDNILSTLWIINVNPSSYKCSLVLRANNGAPYPYIGEKKKPMNGFSRGYSGRRHCSWALRHDGGDTAKDGGHTPAKRLRGTCSLGLWRTSLLLDIHAMSIYTCQNKVSADQYHVTISRAHD